MTILEKEGEFDRILRRLGFGWWSVTTLLPIIFFGMYAAMSSMAGAFMNAQVNHHCHVEALENTSWTLEERLNYSIPWEERGGKLVRSQCYIYNRDYFNVSHVTWNAELEGSNTQEIDDLPQVPCSSWEYDTSTFTSTFSMEFDLVCHHVGLSVLYQSLYFFGTFMVEPVSGYLSDRYGRRVIVRVTAFSSAIITFASSFGNHYAFVLASRFLLGCLHVGGISAYVMGIELSAPQHRTVTGLFLFVFFASGGIFFGGFAYLVRNWRNLTRIVSAMSLMSFIPALLVDESPRWLVRKRRFPEAMKVLKKAARWHGIELESDGELMSLLSESEASTMKLENKNEGRCDFATEFFTDLIKVFKSPTARRVSLYMFGCWFLTGVIYWGISLSGGNWSSNPFLYMSLSALMEGIGYAGFTPCVGRFGRRPFLAITFFVCAIVILSIYFIPPEFGSLIVAMAMIGKLCSSCFYNLLYLGVSELFPTTLRGRSLNFCSTMARLGSLITPFIVEALVTTYPWAPQVVFGCCALIGTFLSRQLPESNNMTLPETLEDMENLYGKKKKDVDREESGL